MKNDVEIRVIWEGNDFGDFVVPLFSDEHLLPSSDFFVIHLLTHFIFIFLSSVSHTHTTSLFSLSRYRQDVSRSFPLVHWWISSPLRHRILTKSRGKTRHTGECLCDLSEDMKHKRREWKAYQTVIHARQKSLFERCHEEGNEDIKWHKNDDDASPRWVVFDILRGNTIFPVMMTLISRSRDSVW